MSLITTFAEHRDGEPRRPALETLSQARRLVDAAGGQVQVVFVGPRSDETIATLASYGADRVHVFGAAELGRYATEPYARAVAQVVESTGSDTVLIPFSAMGKDLAPRVAARLDAGLASDCVGVELVDGELEVRRAMYSGKVYATLRWEGTPRLATLRANVFPLGTPDDSRQVEIVEAEVGTGSRAQATGFEETTGGTKELTEAQTIVSGGRGLKGPEHFHLVEELAAAFDAAVGASRAVVDAGWVDHQMQVGQTGKTVSPTLYLACGISGAIQHLAGMSSSKVIVAINKDADAPIFKVANYGILGDAFEVMPRLTEAAKAYFAAKG